MFPAKKNIYNKRDILIGEEKGGAEDIMRGIIKDHSVMTQTPSQCKSPQTNNYIKFLKFCEIHFDRIRKTYIIYNYLSNRKIYIFLMTPSLN